MYKDINDFTTEKTPTPSNTISECESGVDVASSNKWSSVTSKWPYNKIRQEILTLTKKLSPQEMPVAYTEILFGGVSTNSAEDRGQRERGCGGGSPLSGVLEAAVIW